MKRSPSPLLALGLTLALLLALAAGVAWLASAPAHAASELGSEPAPGPSPSAVLFIENVGQFDPGARFQVRGAAGSGLWLSGDALWLTLLEADPAPAQEPGTPGWEEASAQPPPSRAVNVRLSFVGANPNPDLVPFGRLEAKVSYFLGNDPGRWRAAVPVWSGVRYVDLYPGVDLELTSEGGRYVQRLVVADGSDLGAVRLRIEGAEEVSVDGDALRLGTAVGEVALPLLQVGRTALGDGPPPELHTAGDSFEIASPFATEKTATFTITPTDDPGDLVYGTFLGGSADDGLGGLALAQGEDIVAVTGATKSADFYTTTVGAFDPTHNGGVEDVYVVKLNPAGNGLDDLLCATFLGGSGSDTGSEIRIDPDGNTYVVGGTSSADFPTTTLAYDGSYNDGYDVFVAKLISDCTDLVYSTYLGGSGADWGHGIAVDDGGHAFVTGYTLSGDFPTTEGAYSRVYNASGLEDVFVTAFTPDGQGLAYSTYVGGYWPDFGYDIDVHNGDAFVVGRVEGAGFPTTPGAFDETYNHGGDDGFVLRLNGAGSERATPTWWARPGRRTFPLPRWPTTAPPTPCTTPLSPS
jgi:hypothetical protein